MEEKFLAAVEAARQQASKLGVRIRPVDMKSAKRCLSGSRESDGFYQLVQLGKAELTLEALAINKQFTGLFTDEQANNALTRLLDAGYTFR
jgi:hypothetical protein